MPAPAKKMPKATKKPGNPPRNVKGRNRGVSPAAGGKWKFQFQRNDWNDMIFDTKQEADEYEAHVRNLATKGSPLRVRGSLA